MEDSRPPAQNQQPDDIPQPSVESMSAGAPQPPPPTPPQYEIGPPEDESSSRYILIGVVALVVIIVVIIIVVVSSGGDDDNGAGEATATQVVAQQPTEEPTEEPTEAPTEEPTEEPTEAPTEEPTEEPTEAPTEAPTEETVEEPTAEPTEETVEEPTEETAVEPTTAPVQSAPSSGAAGDVIFNGSVAFVSDDLAQAGLSEGEIALVEPALNGACFDYVRCWTNPSGRIRLSGPREYMGIQVQGDGIVIFANAQKEAYLNSEDMAAMTGSGSGIWIVPITSEAAADVNAPQISLGEDQVLTHVGIVRDGSNQHFLYFVELLR
ncbi:MAG: hypothetical protein D6737_06060 [Chloroflexi bacterium]|nr:MAG: hypothetical protein D6737_06060 [Chloroflexota bacterium]